MRKGIRRTQRTGTRGRLNIMGRAPSADLHAGPTGKDGAGAPHPMQGEVLPRWTEYLG